MKKLIIFFCLFVSLCCAVSCEEDGLFEDPSASSSGFNADSSDTAEDMPDRAVMVVTYNDKSVETKGQVYQVNFDADSEDDRKNSYEIVCTHYKGSKASSYGYNFSSDDARLINVENNRCAVDCSALSLGMHTIRAKSLVSDAFDKTFIINAVSALKNICIDYKIQDKYKPGSGLEYDESMLQGTITRFTKKLTLLSGAVYDMVVRDAGENSNLKVSDLNVQINGDYINVREVRGDAFELVCKNFDKQTSRLVIQVGGSDVGLSCSFTLKDISQSVLEVLEPNADNETVISLVANTADDPDRVYSYQIKTNSILENRTVDFSLDYLVIGRDEEESIVKTPDYVLQKNGNVHWGRNSIAKVVFEGKELFDVEYNGVLGIFSIKPLGDTVFTSSNNREYNLHTYLYVKYVEDEKEVCRYRFRIMVGGNLEKLDLVQVDPESGDETPLESDIAVREGDETGWVFRANYIPSTTENNRTIWYLSDSKKEYLWKGNEADDEFKAPKPLEQGDPRFRVLNMMTSREGEYSMNYNAVIDGSSAPFKVYKWYLDDAETGHSDLWCTYNSLGLDIVVVALNVDQKLYTCVGIKDLGDKQIIVKSLADSAYPPALYKEQVTGYDGGETVQEYPKTIVSGHESERTFYMKYDDNLRLEFLSSFKLSDMSAYGDVNAREILTTLEPSISDDGLTGYLSVKSVLATEPEASDDRKEQIKQQCLKLGDDGVNVYAVFDAKYKVKLRIVIYG